MITRVLIADDHPVYGQGLTRLLASYEDIEVVATCSDGLTALAQIRELRPDVAVLDHGMPALDGMALLGMIRAEGLQTNVAIISGQINADALQNALDGGAMAYMLKTAPPEEIAAMILRAANIKFPTQASLTAREVATLCLVMEGHSRAEIGERLNVTENTVKTHLTHIYHKLGVSSRAGAIREACRQGIILR